MSYVSAKTVKNEFKWANHCYKGTKTYAFGEQSQKKFHTLDMKYQFSNFLEIQQ